MFLDRKREKKKLNKPDAKGMQQMAFLPASVLAIGSYACMVGHLDVKREIPIVKCSGGKGQRVPVDPGAEDSPVTLCFHVA